MNLMKKSILMVISGCLHGLFLVTLVFADTNNDPSLDSAPDINTEAFEDIDTILNTQLRASEYSDTQNCIYTRAYDGVEIIDERHILFRGKRGKAWINQLRHRCPGLRPDKMLIMEIRGSRLCIADTFTSREKGDNLGISPLCRFGKFQSVSAEQLPLLYEALAKYSQTRTVHRTTKLEGK